MAPSVKRLQSELWPLGDQFLRRKDHGVFPQSLANYHQHSAPWKHPRWVGIRDALLAEVSDKASLSMQVLFGAPVKLWPQQEMQCSVYSKDKRSFCHRHAWPVLPAAADAGGLG